jgi:hypothetical protein
VLGDDAAARRHLQDALARHEAMAATPLAARTRMELARLRGYDSLKWPRLGPL